MATIQDYVYLSDLFEKVTNHTFAIWFVAHTFAHVYLHLA